MENNKQTHKSVLKNEENAIEWLNQFVEEHKNDMPILKEMTEILYADANKRLVELKSRDNKEIAETEIEKLDAEKIFEDILEDKYVEKYLIKSNDEKNNTFRLEIYSDVEDIKKLKSDKEFWEKILCLSKDDLNNIKNSDIPETKKENAIKKVGLTNEEIDKIKTIELQEILETKGKLRKVLRFYNMQTKHAHTAKTVYIAFCATNKKGKGNIHAQETALISTVLHDIGRFYQAANYDGFFDGDMKNDPVIDEYNMEERMKGIVEKTNELNNGQIKYGHSSIGYYYSMAENFVLNCFGNINDPKLQKIMIASFVVRFHSLSNATLTGLETVRGENYKKLSPAEERENFESFLTLAFKEADPLLIEKHIKEDIKDFIYSIVEKKVSEVTKNVGESFDIDSKDTIEKICKKIIDINDPQNQNNNFLRKAIEFFSQKYDGNDTRLNKLAEELADMTNQALREELGEEYSQGIIVKDFVIGLREMADYDIATSVYNILTDEDKEKQEKFGRYKELFYYPLIITMDSDKIDILNQLSVNKMPEEMFKPKKYNIWVKEEMTVEKLYYELGLDKKEVKLSEFCDELNLNKDAIIKEKTPIGINPDWCRYYWHEKNMDVNNDNSNLDNNNRPKLMTGIMYDDDKENFFKFNGMKPSIKDMSTLRKTLWRINQFLFTNMRLRSSFEILRDVEIIEDIYGQFAQEDREIIRPYIEYALYFIEKSINGEYELDTEKAMKEHNEKVKEDYDDPETDKDLKQKCISRLDAKERRLLGGKQGPQQTQNDDDDERCD